MQAQRTTPSWWQRHTSLSSFVFVLCVPCQWGTVIPYFRHHKAVVEVMHQIGLLKIFTCATVIWQQSRTRQAYRAEVFSLSFVVHLQDVRRSLESQLIFFKKHSFKVPKCIKATFSKTQYCVTFYFYPENRRYCRWNNRMLWFRKGLILSDWGP